MPKPLRLFLRELGRRLKVNIINAYDVLVKRQRELADPEGNKAFGERIKKRKIIMT